MLYNEYFYPNHQMQNDLLTVRQAGRLSKDASYRIERNNSRTNVMAFVEEGCLHVEEADRKFIVCAGQSLFLPEGTEYTIYADPKQPPLMYWLNIRGLVFGAMVASFKLGTTVSECQFCDVFDAIISLIRDKENRFDPIAEAVFSLLLRIRSGKVTSKAQSPTVTDSVYEAYICNHIQEKFSVRQMAKDFHISTDAVNRIFTRQYGITPYQYYQAIRIDFAKELLTKTDLTIDDIAARLSFTDRNYFSLYFKKKVGYAPACYRKRMSGH